MNETYRIKPLIWQERDHPRDLQVSTLFGKYRAFKDAYGIWAQCPSCQPHKVDTIEYAKSICETHYKTSIKSALEEWK